MAAEGTADQIQKVYITGPPGLPSAPGCEYDALGKKSKEQGARCQVWVGCKKNLFDIKKHKKKIVVVMNHWSLFPSNGDGNSDSNGDGNGDSDGDGHGDSIWSIHELP